MNPRLLRLARNPRGRFARAAGSCLCLLALAACGSNSRPSAEPARADASAALSATDAAAPRPPEADYMKPSAEELKKKLTPEQFHVTQEEGTERAFRNAYWDNHAEGLYVDIVSGEPLFASRDKFDSGTGWPSFTQPLVRENIVEKTDRSLGMARTEVRSKHADSHLGHVFDDGPAPTGMRYCMNSASLRFIPAAKVAESGYPELARQLGFPAAPAASKPAPASAPAPVSSAAGGAASATQVATLAGGCFWGMEDILRKLPGVIDTTVGYTGGTTANATYELIKTHTTGHAEAIEIRFDPAKLSYAALLDTFFRMHDPTTLNRQGNDIGDSYRSAIFVHDAEQRREAEAAIARAQASGRWKRPIVTQIADAGPFWKAEDYHQDYLEKHPGGYTCHYLRD